MLAQVQITASWAFIPTLTSSTGSTLGGLYSRSFLPQEELLSAIPACLGVREGLINSPGLSQSWGLAVTACLRIPGTYFSLDPLGAVALLIE